ncbi:hypothetical protein BZA05DRAFT_398362 [Tricharina praecox]|uniref:uncharacterized protein n=1 Tax=Tricharina praecox TaxID=43433 RepID=UPI0022202BFE|nr:uncharacterized protein BZA05DRAFT_398362 [Tricharina praecox]KAI5851945.1 hypothetical protein BZA05DRAFT_398362 [Tricharina praecox]
MYISPDYSGYRLEARQQQTASNITDTDGLPKDDMIVLTRSVLAVLLVLSTTVCGARLYVRYFIVKSFGIDDVMVIVALILCVGFAVLGLCISHVGVGVHLWNVPPEDLVVYFKIYYAAICSYVYVALAVKTSLLVFLMRVFPGAMLHKCAKCIIIFLCVFTVGTEFATTFSCNPVQAGWDKSIVDANCWSIDVLYNIVVFQGIVMSLSDVVILLLPMWDLWKLKLPTRKRLQLMIMFGLGMLATIVSIIRLSTAVASTKDTSDFTYTSARALLMMNVEFHVGLITGSLPSLRLLPGFRVLFASWTGDHSTKGYSGRISGNGDGSAMRNGAGSRANDMKLGRMPKSPYGDIISVLALHTSNRLRSIIIYCIIIRTLWARSLLSPYRALNTKRAGERREQDRFKSTDHRPSLVPHPFPTQLSSCDM